jgi:hypothetical protein
VDAFVGVGLRPGDPLGRLLLGGDQRPPLELPPVGLGV